MLPKSVIMKLELAIEFTEQACPFKQIVRTSHADTSSSTVIIEDFSSPRSQLGGLNDILNLDFQTK